MLSVGMREDKTNNHYAHKTKKYLNCRGQQYLTNPATNSVDDYKYC